MIKTNIGNVQIENDFRRIVPRNTIRSKCRISKRGLRNKSITNYSKLQIEKHTRNYFNGFNRKNLYMKSYLYNDFLKIRSFVYTNIRDLSKKKNSHYNFGRYINRKENKI